MKISTLSQGELIQIYSSFVTMTTPALDCRVTAKRANKQIAANQHNCNFTYKRRIFELDDITWNSCLCRFKHSNFNELMIMNKHYERGHIADSLLDTPNIMIERMEVLDHLKNLHKEEKQKEQERKSNGRSSKARQPQTQKPPRNLNKPK